MFSFLFFTVKQNVYTDILWVQYSLATAVINVLYHLVCCGRVFALYFKSDLPSNGKRKRCKAICTEQEEANSSHSSRFNAGHMGPRMQIIRATLSLVEVLQHHCVFLFMWVLHALWRKSWEQNALNSQYIDLFSTLNKSLEVDKKKTDIASSLCSRGIEFLCNVFIRIYKSDLKNTLGFVREWILLLMYTNKCAQNKDCNACIW